MSADYEVRPDNRLVITARGSLTADDLAQLRNEWQGDPRLDTVVDTLVDCRDITDWSVSPATLRQYAGRRADVAHLHDRRSRLAIVSSSDVGYGLARLYAQSGEQFGAIEVFRTLDAAEEWLTAERRTF